MTGRGADPEIDVMRESTLWPKDDSEAVVRHAIVACADHAPPLSEVSIVLTDDAHIKALNAQYRGKDAATNVLSFPVTTGSAGAPRLLGDIVIAYETTAREAEREGKSLAHHLAHLTVHGFLHLLGYDHESEAEAETMERLERDILARLDIPDPYDTRDTEA